MCTRKAIAARHLFTLRSQLMVLAAIALSTPLATSCRTSVNERTGNSFLRAAPNSVYPTRDGEWLAIGGNSQSIFRRLTALMGNPQLADDPRFATNQARVAHAAELDGIIASWTRSLDLEQANAALAAAGVPAGPVMSIAAIA